MQTVEPTQSQRRWARVAGLMFWVVLVFDLSGLAIHSGSASTWLPFVGSLGTVPLALGLFFALRPVQRAQAATALCCRLLEAALGILATLLGLASVRVALQHSALGTNLLAVADWNQRTLFGAFIFTVGSTIFFGLFVASRYIPRWLAWLGLLASVVAFAACLAHLVQPSFPAMTAWAWIPMLIAEPLTGGWLLVKSLRARA